MRDGWREAPHDGAWRRVVGALELRASDRQWAVAVGGGAATSWGEADSLDEAMRAAEREAGVSPPYTITVTEALADPRELVRRLRCGRPTRHLAGLGAHEWADVIERLVERAEGRAA